MNSLRKGKKYFSFLLLSLIFGILANNFLFSHVHQLPDGSIVTHAHPFTSNTLPDSPYQTHRHTTVELFIIQQLNSVLSLLVFAAFLMLYFSPEQILPQATIRYLTIHGYSRSIRLRGPPTLI